jgi:hypothetical protein
MARKKSKDSAGALGLLLFAALATLITVAAAVYAVIVFVAWVYYGNKAKRIPPATSDGYFIATHAESRQISELKRILSKERKTLSGLKSEGHELSRRSDGDFDERSALGKRLNREISRSVASERGLVIELTELQEYSHQRREHYLNIKVAAASWRKAGFAFLIAIACFTVYTPTWVSVLNHYLSNSGWMGQINSMPLIWGVLAAAAMVSLAVQQLSRFYYRSAYDKELANGDEPGKLAAAWFTEYLAAQSEIGIYSSEDFERADNKLMVSEQQQPIAVSVMDAPTTQQPPASASQQTAELVEQPVTKSSFSPPAESTPPKSTPHPTRALWKRVLASTLFTALGFFTGIVAFGLTGQGNFGTALVLIFPIVGMVWGFNFRKHLI